MSQPPSKRPIKFPKCTLPFTADQLPSITFFEGWDIRPGTVGLVNSDIINKVQHGVTFGLTFGEPIRAIVGGWFFASYSGRTAYDKTCGSGYTVYHLPDGINPEDLHYIVYGHLNALNPNVRIPYKAPCIEPKHGHIQLSPGGPFGDRISRNTLPGAVYLPAGTIIGYAGQSGWERGDMSRNLEEVILRDPTSSPLPTWHPALKVTTKNQGLLHLGVRDWNPEGWLGYGIDPFGMYNVLGKYSDALRKPLPANKETIFQTGPNKLFLPAPSS
jgi:hypothetical protein